MASTATAKFKVLWANEVREASRLMKLWHDCTDDAERDKLMAAAFNAALVALWDIDEHAIVVLGSEHIQRIVTDTPNVELDTEQR